MKLVEDWKQAHTWISVKLSALGVVATGLWIFLPVVQSVVSPETSVRITLGLFVLIGLGRIVDQGKKDV